MNKDNNNFFFEETVIDFYRESNEVEEFCKLFDLKIKPLIQQKKCNNWLDVGIGNGEKILQMFKGFENMPRLSYIEPSNKWINELMVSGNQRKLEKITDVCGINRMFEDSIYLRDWFNFDVISFIHVLYDNRLVDSLFKFIDKKINKYDCTLIINLEGENNDLFKMRKLISKGDNNIAPVSQLSKIEDNLKVRKLKYQRFVSNKRKSLNLSPQEIIDNTNSWFYPFILGCTKSDFFILSEDRKKEYIRTIHNYLGQIEYINIEDVTLVINHQ